jgi:hypothetical protein
MTGLGAAIYGGFFGLAALWLFLTADRAEGSSETDQPNDKLRSKSMSADDALAWSSPFSASHSSQK